MTMKHHSNLTPAELATIETCTPDFIAGVQYALRLCQALTAEYQTEAGLQPTDVDEGWDYLQSVASGAQECASKLERRLMVMQYEGWIPSPEFLSDGSTSPESAVPSVPVTEPPNNLSNYDV